jgi:hypothetical protein
MPANEQNPLLKLTWFGVRPARNAPAARYRPSRRLTNLEYAGVPADGFCARDSSAATSPT